MPEEKTQIELTRQALAESLQNIKVQMEDPVVILTMNHPKALNALDDQTLETPDHNVTALSRDREILGVIITGEDRAIAKTITKIMGIELAFI